jgi:carbonic anhydrase/acetyltransferase-like protein (isoleucine patch superfamily)
MLHFYRDQFPRVHASVFCADSSDIIGDVEIGEQSSVWFKVVIRGDVNHIRIGSRTSIQDGSVIHVSSETFPTRIGDDVTIGHNVTLHGCTIGHRCLIGMGAIVLDGAIVEDDAKVAAGALVTPGTIVRSRTLYVGSPARYRRDLTEAEIVDLVRAAQNYVDYAADYLGS